MHRSTFGTAFAAAIAAAGIGSTARAGVYISYTGATTPYTTYEGLSTQYVVNVSLNSPSTTLNGWGATISWNDGATASIGGGYTAYASRVWADEGTYSASLSGSGTGSYYGGAFVGTKYQDSTLAASLPAITVLNVAPTITSITGDLSVGPGDSFAYAATATDPGINDVLTFDWDFNGDNVYGDATGASGTWSFANAGVYPVGLRVGDGDGGLTYGNFVVTAPEPAALGAVVAGAAVLLGRRRRRRA